jgi:Na+-transporting NADH:ubiquinone oxidoreductase subunit D
LGAGAGYSFVLLFVALVRESMGFGALFGYKLPGLEYWWHSWTIMVMPAGAFFVLAVAVWIARGYALRREAAAQEKGAAR